MDRELLIAGIFESTAALRRLIMAQQAPLYSGRESPTHAQASVLFAISQHDDASIKHVAGCFSMTSSAVTQVVNDLVDRGWVVRKEAAHDRRQVTLTLSAKGKRLVAKLVKRRTELFAQHLAPLTQAELRELKRLQDKIINHHR